MKNSFRRPTACLLALLLAGASGPMPLQAAPLSGIEPAGSTLRIRTTSRVPFQIERSTANEVVLFLPGTEAGTVNPQSSSNLGEVRLEPVTGGLRLSYKPRQLGTTFDVVAVGSGANDQAIEIRPTNTAATVPPPVATPPLPTRRIDVGERVTIKVRDGDIRDTLTLLGRVAKANVVAESNLNGRVSLNLERVSFADALDALSRAANLTVTKGAGDVYVVSQPKPGQNFLPPIPQQPPGAAGDPSKRLVSVNVKNAELGSVIENMATQAGVQLIIKGGSVPDRITARIAGVPFEEALDQILKGTRFGFDRQGQTYLIGDVSPGSLVGQALQRSEVIPLAYTPVKNVTPLLPGILAQYVKPDATRNAVVISGTETQRAQLRDLLKKIDQPLKQVVFEVKIVELNDEGSRALNALRAVQNGSAVNPSNAAPLSLGGLLSTNTAFGTFNDVARILEVVSGLITERKGKLVTDTKLNTISGNKAQIDVQTDINILLTQPSFINGVAQQNQTISTLRAGTVVEIEPTVQADGNVLAVLSLESSVAGTTASTNIPPNISRRKVKNTLLIKDGQTIEIGGLIQNNATEEVTRLPLLGYIPLIGQLFSNTSVRLSQQELVVFLTPASATCSRGRTTACPPSSSRDEAFRTRRLHPGDGAAPGRHPAGDGHGRLCPERQQFEHHQQRARPRRGDPFGGVGPRLPAQRHRQ